MPRAMFFLTAAFPSVSSENDNFVCPENVAGIIDTS